MRKGDRATLQTPNETLYPGLRPGEILAVQLGGWCEYHGEGCCNVIRATDGKKFHVADVHLRKLERKG